MLSKFLVFFLVAQIPAPVYGIKIEGNLTSCVRVRFEMNTTASESSYITYLIVYLNNDTIKNISARQRRFFFIHRLEPLTEYELGIETQDGSWQKSTKVTQNFTLKEG